MGGCAIFDMDGLIFDTERLSVEVSVLAAEEQGISLTRELILSTLGLTDKQTVFVYENTYASFDSPRFMKSLKDLMFKDISNNGMRIKKFARECVSAFRKAGIPTALASSNSTSVVLHYLEKAGMTADFDVLVCGDSGFPSKPAPDIFLRAASLVNVSPAQCTVFEDSPNGLKAARAAGMRVYMVPDLVPYDDSLAPYCDGVLNDLGEATGLIGSMICL